MLELEYDMAFAARRAAGTRYRFPSRLCWKIAEGALPGPRISACPAIPGIDWIRVERNGIRRQDQRAQFLTHDGVLILMRYDAGLIREDEGLGRVCMTSQFGVNNDSCAW